MVVDSWRQASADPLPLHHALAGRLPGRPAERAGRAWWITDTVARLTERLDHPASFMPEAAGILARRMPVSMHELAQDREALLGALTDLLGPLDPGEDRAWSHAIDLFAEITSSVCLDPFAANQPTNQQ